MADGNDTVMTDSSMSDVPANPILQAQAPAIFDVPKPATPSNAKLCAVCSVGAAKYKCTLCEIPYCSVACNKEHKANHPPVPEPQIPEAKPTAMDNSYTGYAQNAMRAGTQAAAGRQDVLAPLKDTADLENLFTKYPTLRGQLRDIYDASQPPKEDENGYIKGSRFNLGRDRAFWTKEQGVRDGVEALLIDKRKVGKEGEGVREFAELVVKLVSPENIVNGNLDRPEVIAKQTQDDNAKMITQLLMGDLGNA